MRHGGSLLLAGGAEKLWAWAAHAGRSGVLCRQGEGRDGGRCPACDGAKGDELRLTGLLYTKG